MASGKISLIETPDAFAAAFTVSRETVGRLIVYEAMLKRWQKTINLVAPSTINHIWHRHFADSAQLWSVGCRVVHRPPPSCREGPASPPPSWGRPGGGEYRNSPSESNPIAPPGNPPAATSGIPPTPNPSPQGGGEAAHWLDLGSGAGFPGLVIAILAAEQGGTTHTLIESDSRKAAFLREVARETGVAVDILCARIEIPETRARVREVNCVTARALAPLPRLAELAYPYFGSTTVGIFAKGREVSSEIEETARSWDFTHELFPSVTDAEGRVLLLKSLSLKR